MDQIISDGILMKLQEDCTVHPEMSSVLLFLLNCLE